MLSLKEIRDRIIKEEGLQIRRSSFYDNSGDNALLLLTKIMQQYPDKIAEIEEQIGEGEDFRSYFEDDDTLQELNEMRSTDPDRFYRIIRKEELFLNTCLQTFGFHNYLISLNPDKLFGEQS